LSVEASDKELGDLKVEIESLIAKGRGK